MSAYVKRAVLYFSDISKIYHYQSERLPAAVSQALSVRSDCAKLVTGGPRRNVVSELLKMREYMSLICVNFLNNF